MCCSLRLQDRSNLLHHAGYQLHLHAHRTAPLPDDEFAAREIMDRERTWIDLCAFDQTFFLQSGDDDDGFHQVRILSYLSALPFLPLPPIQTCMIPCFRINVVSWLEETKAYGVRFLFIPVLPFTAADGSSYRLRTTWSKQPILSG